jgi:hypothetical protein
MLRRVIEIEMRELHPLIFTAHYVVRSRAVAALEEREVVLTFSDDVSTWARIKLKP